MFIPRVYRPDKRWPWYTFLLIEFPLTVALLALFGIADPDTYRTKLWQDGSDNGFNSSPLDQLYAYANYRSYKVPIVWSQWVTNYNVVISVLSTFILLVKATIYIVHCFPPLLSFVVHGTLVALYAVSAYCQSAPDMSDPAHPQPGAPWYITKPCSVAALKNDIQYCEQAKSAFACTIIVIIVFACQTIHALYSILFPSRATKEEHRQKRARSKSAYAEAAALTPSTATARFFPRTPAPFSPGTTGGLKSPSVHVSQNPETWGTEATEADTMQSNNRTFAAAGIQPMTPRTHAFNRLGGTKDLPLRQHFSTPNAPRSPTFGVKSPLAASFNVNGSATAVDDDIGADRDVEKGIPKPMYFPPPPKVAASKKK